MMKRQVAILAGGLGTRLRPITEKIPKPLAEVAGKPFLFWQLMDLKRQGYTDILLLVSYLGEQIQDYFGNGSQFGLNIQYSWEHEPLGTGGALKNALALLEDEFILLNGDSFLRAPLDQMVRVFESEDSTALLATYDNRIPTPVVPNLKVDGRTVHAYKKNGGIENGYDVIDAGVYLLKRSCVAAASEARFQLEDLWPQLIADKKMTAFLVTERFYDIGTPERLHEFALKLKTLFQNEQGVSI